jgi:hypothetical protein
MDNEKLIDKVISASSGGTLVSFRVQTGASKEKIQGFYGENAIKIAVKAPPVDGKANAAICKFISKLCGIPKSSVGIITGETSRNKRVILKGVSPARARKIFLQQI